MNSTRHVVLVAIIALLIVGAVAACAVDATLVSRDASCSRSFQALLRGFGTGSACELSECDAMFDARLAGVCPYDATPVAGASFLCPYHAGVVRHPTFEETPDDAQVP
jgi:hypothetical protein